jgi:hypothetical protein
LFISVALAVAGVSVMVGGAAASSSTGYDISYPQCNGSFPSSPGFGIVGVNGGRPYSPNPCLGAGDGPSELAWAGMSAQLYANTADPGPTLSTHWPNGQTSPEQCNTASNPGPNTAECNYDYGWNAATDSYHDAVNGYVSLGWAASGAPRTPVANAWWLDVESANSWTSNTTFNVDSLQGEVDYLKSVGAASVGFYSTASDWQTITAGTSNFSAYPSWVPGASTLTQAQANCAGQGFTGGGVALTQYPYNGFDGDYQCGAPSATLSFTSNSQKLTAGSPSSAMTVGLSQAPSSTIFVTLASSSSAGSYATSPSGQWSWSLTLTVSPNSTTTSSFYYRDTRAGQPLLTASATDYTEATQTETIVAGSLATITVNPASVRLHVGAPQSFSATGQDGYGNSVAVTNPSWSVPPALGSLSSYQGNPVTFTAGNSAGSGAIIASEGSISGTASITVTAKRRSQAATKASLDTSSLARLIRIPSARACVRGRFVRIRARSRAAAQLAAVRILLNGELVAFLRGSHNAAGVELVRPSASRFAVTIVAITRAGRTIAATYQYHGCATQPASSAKRPPTMLPAIPGG